MLTCSQCGRTSSLGSTFCAYCGGAFPEVTVAEPTANQCPKCGAEDAGDKKFCGNCGANLEEARKPTPAPIQQVPASKHCTNCGAEIEAGYKFCSRCGNSVQAKAAEPITRQPAPVSDDRSEGAAVRTDQPSKPAPPPPAISQVRPVVDSSQTASSIPKLPYAPLTLFVFALISLIINVLAPVVWIAANQSFKAMRRDGTSHPQVGLLTAARVIGAVVTVCGVLIVGAAAILFPVFAQARLAAKRNVLLSEGKQASLAILMYANDFDDCQPQPEQWHHGEVVFPYIKNQKILDQFQYAYTGPLALTEIVDPTAEIMGFVPGVLAETSDKRVEAYADGHAKWNVNPPPITNDAICKNWIQTLHRTYGEENITEIFERDIHPGGKEVCTSIFQMTDKGDTDPTNLIKITTTGKEDTYTFSNGHYVSGSAAVGNVTFLIGGRTLDKPTFDKIAASIKDPDGRRIFDEINNRYEDSVAILSTAGQEDVIKCDDKALLVKTESGNLATYRVKN